MTLASGHRSVCRLAVLLALLLPSWSSAAGTAWGQVPLAAGCAAALAAEGLTLDGLPMERWTWDGDEQALGLLDGHRLLLCRASGPPELLPLQNAIGCLLIDDRAARVDDRLACGALLNVEQPSNTLLWVAHNSAATVQVTPLRWTGNAFSADAPFIACADMPLRPVHDPLQPSCAPPRLAPS